MVPSAYVYLDSFPLTPNGKLDRKALPAPDPNAFIVREYEEPAGEVEQTIAQIWTEVLKRDRVSRHDNFFELGGHSLSAMTLVDRMRQAGLEIDVRTLFAIPILAGLALLAGRGDRTLVVPPNLIPPDCTIITPEMLPLLQLSQSDIDKIVASVPGGASNVQDIYPLAPLQEGLLFHHLLEKEGDVYLSYSLFAADSRQSLERYSAALQRVIERHDILRTSVFWQGLPEPVQVVSRHAPLSLEEVDLDPASGDICNPTSVAFRSTALPHRFARCSALALVCGTRSS